LITSPTITPFGCIRLLGIKPRLHMKKNYAAKRLNIKCPFLLDHYKVSHSTSVRLASLMGEERWQDLQDRNVQQVLDTIKERLDKFCQDTQKELIDCPFIVEDIVVKQGEPGGEVLKQADSTDCDLIVMGTHGQSALANAMLGSTARWVVRRSERPVLVIRLPENGI